MDIDHKQLRELMRSLKQFDVAELELEKDGERIYLRRGADAPAGVIATSMMPSQMPVAMPHMAVGPASVPPPPPSPSAPPDTDDPNLTEITSPFVGTFYRSPGPESAAFVEVGSTIRPGQPLCIVEAMKLMNEIEAEIGGTIVAVLVENGKPVEYGTPLFKVRKAG